MAPRPSLHSRIFDDIRRRIVEGEWPPGFALARETDLAARYGVSRMTMNKALTQLAQDGYVVRRKRHGTFVARPRTQSAVMAISNIADEVMTQGRNHRWQLLSRELRVLRPTEARRLGLRPPLPEAAVLLLTGLHRADAEPFCLESRAINPAEVPQAPTTDFSTRAPGSWLLQTMPWSTARHAIRALDAAPREARLLGLPEGAACLEVLRLTERDGAWITCARLLYPGDAHQLTAEFGLRGGAAAGQPSARPAATPG